MRSRTHSRHLPAADPLMQICPNCLTASLTTEFRRCASCEWQARELNGVRDFLSNSQREDRTLQDYAANYEELAKKKIVESNIDRTFLTRQAPRSEARRVGK